MSIEQHAVVFIHLDGEFVPAGRLRMVQDNRDVVSHFDYGLRYLERPNAVAVDPVSLHLDREHKTAPGLFGAFHDAAPDAWGRHLIDIAAESSGERPTEFDYLTIPPLEDRIGALGFGTTPDSEPKAFQPEWLQRMPDGAQLDLAEMLHAADRIQLPEELDPKHRRFLIRGSSVGGAQPKAPTTFQGRAYLAKFSREREAWSTCRIEHATALLAARCGIRTVPAQVITLLGRDIFLAERFDRDLDGSRKHYLSGRTALRAGDMTDGSYQQLAEALRLYGVSEKLAADLEELFRRMVFNVLCNNTDDHLKNHGFLYDPMHRRWRLSPSFDIVPQPVMESAPELPGHLSLRLGDKGREASLENALSRCDAFGLRKQSAASVIEEMLHTVKQWREVFTAASVPEKDIPTLTESFRVAERA